MERYWNYSMRKLLPMLALVLFTSAANANALNDKANAITNWISVEKEKTIEFQKKGWADGKLQLVNNWNKIKSLFGIK